ncbi:ATP-dependent helicase, partial [bacterium]|nr:ATP-dependent helicase [bacterium]
MSEFDERFAAELAKLNPQQRAAVEALEGPVMVIAGPGTGKTQVLTLRIANLIYQGLAEPGEILALTFTNAAAANMRTRLSQLIGPAAYGVNFHTFHSFAESVIAGEPEFFSSFRQSHPLDDLEATHVLQKIIDDLQLVALRPAGTPDYYINAVRDRIGKLKNENITPEHFAQLVASEASRIQAAMDEELARKRPRKGVLDKLTKKRDKQAELAKVYTAYERVLGENGAYDFADMILTVINKFKQNSDLLASYQEKFSYILVDEYQDTNNSQNQLVDLLAAYWGEAANVFVVGDPQQSIFRFQGANLASFLQFKKRYPGAQLITLTTGYRCSDKTYCLAHTLSQAATPAAYDWLVQQQLTNFAQRVGRAAQLCECDSTDSEICHIFESIQNLIKNGKKYEDIVIIYRNNSEAEALVAASRHYGVPYNLASGDNVLTTPVTQTLHRLCRLLGNLADSEQADALLLPLLWHEASGLARLDVAKVNQLAFEQRVSLRAVVLDSEHPAWVQLAAQGVKADSWRRWGEKILAWEAAAQTKPVSEALSEIVEESGFLSWMKKQRESLQILSDYYSLLRQVLAWEQSSADFSWAQMLTNWQTMLERKLPLNRQNILSARQGVTLTTAHKAKGQEWDEVFIYGLNHGVWDNVKQKTTIELPPGIIPEQDPGEESDEQKRLLYVALTRARQDNFVSWHTRDSVEADGKLKQPAAMAMELCQQQAAGLTETASDQVDAGAARVRLETLLTPPPELPLDASVRDFLRAGVQNLAMSATMLNDYLRDEQEFVAKHLLHAPTVSSQANLAFGNSLHHVLERAVREFLRTGRWPTVVQLQKNVSSELRQARLAAADALAWEKLAHTTLENYYETLVNSRPWRAEASFGLAPRLHWQDIPVVGKIDRLVIIDEQANTVCLVDYNTGRARTDNQIAGKVGWADLS